MTQLYYTDASLKQAVDTFMERFSTVPGSWLVLVAQHIDKDDFVPMPMWGSCFKVDDSGLESMIRNLCVDGPIVPSDPTALAEFAEDKGLNIEDHALTILALLSDGAEDAEDYEDEIDEIRESLLDQLRDDGDEDLTFMESGWSDVGSTGFMARYFDGQLCLGVNGCGYDFKASHWTNLYMELGLKWHNNSNKEV